MKKLIMILSAALLMTACKKETVEPTPPAPSAPSTVNHYKVVLDHQELIAPLGNMGVNAVIGIIHYDGSIADTMFAVKRIGLIFDPDFTGDWSTTLGHFETEFDLAKDESYVIDVEQSSGDIVPGGTPEFVNNSEWLKCRIYKNGILVVDKYVSNYDSTTGFYGITTLYDN